MNEEPSQDQREMAELLMNMGVESASDLSEMIGGSYTSDSQGSKNSSQQKEASDEEIVRIMRKSKRTELTEEDWSKLPEEKRKEVYPSRRPDYERPGTGGKRPISPEEYLVVLPTITLFFSDDVAQRVRLQHRLAFECGLRRKEIRSVKKKYFRPAQEELHLPGSVTKNDEPHTVSLTGELLEELEAYTEDLSGEDWVFQPCRWGSPEKGGTQISDSAITDNLAKLKKGLVQYAGWTVDEARSYGYHSLRKGGAVQVYKQGGIEAARVFLNHKDVRTTQRYLGLVRQRMGETVEKVHEILYGSRASEESDGLNLREILAQIREDD